MPTAPQPAPITLQLPPNPPAMPDDLVQRFPSLKDWQTKFNQWYENLSQSLDDANQAQSTQINNQVNQITALQTELAAIQPGPFAAGAPVAIGTVEIVDDAGNVHKAMVST